MTLPNPNTKSYVRGFNDGYIQGVENNPYDTEKNAISHIQYKWGYDAGVAVYCREKHPEDE